MRYNSHITSLQQRLLDQKLDGIVITKRENLAYLIGLRQIHPVNREAILLLTTKQVILYHSPFLTPPNFPWLTTISMSKKDPLELVYKRFFQTNHDMSIGIESNNMTVAEKFKLQTALPHINLVDTQNLVEAERLIKNADEIKLLRHAGHLTASLMSWTFDLLDLLRGGQKRQHLASSDGDLLFQIGWPPTELSLTHAIEAFAYQLGAETLSFPPVVAFGPHSALPHHQPGKTKLKPNDIVLIDIGCTYKGYASDMTRTFAVGTPPPKFLEIEAIVKSAYSAAITKLSQHFRVEILTDRNQKKKPPRLSQTSSVVDLFTAAQLDHSVRSVIENAGYGDYFIHTTGHGLGLEIHEQPSLNGSNDTSLVPGMVITVEPGIYLPNRFGYRHENTILIN